MAINSDWHAEHRMPENPSFDQRVEWHAEHRDACDCRPPPEDILLELEKRRPR
jgi:hypothetical protein